MGDNIVFFSGVNWDFLWMRHNHLAMGLAQNNNVLFVNSGQGPGVAETDRERVTVVFDGPAGRLAVYTPAAISPALPKIKGAGRLIRPISDRLLKKYIADNFPEPILWCTRPEHVKWLGHLGEKLVCYDCLDDYASFDDIKPSRKKELLGMEQELAARSDLVFATAGRLRDRMQSFNPNTHLLQNAADFDHFNKASRDLAMPAELENMSGPIVGYIGVLAYWLDYELIEYLLQKNPATAFVFIGPISVDLSRFARHKNAHFLSKRDYRDLPKYLSHFDVCIIPFQINEVTKSTDPIKLYEYLSAGKPVVSTSLPELEEYKDVVRICSSKEGFNQAVQESLKEKSPALKEKRIQVAKENSWGNRVGAIVKLLDAALAAKV